jgi:hypothetical protein
LWEPSFGIKVDLGDVERPAPNGKIFEDDFTNEKSSAWDDSGTATVRGNGRMSVAADTLALLNSLVEADLVAAVDAQSNSDAGIVVRYHSPEDYLLASYSPKEHALSIGSRTKGTNLVSLGKTPVRAIGSNIRLSTEVRGRWAIVSISDGKSTYTTPIVDVSNTDSGKIGLKHEGDGTKQSFSSFVLRQSPILITDTYLQRKLYDARGNYRGEIRGPGLPSRSQVAWDDFAKQKCILLDAYRPPQFPTTQDWVLVMEPAK